mgnify:CR=1 FL=1
MKTLRLFSQVCLLAFGALTSSMVSAQEFKIGFVNTDRIFREPGFLYGHVIDWIELPHWPVFNLADSAIFIAAGIAILLTFKNISPIAQSGKNE